VAELGLNRFALQELRVVKDQQVDRAQTFLESDRRLRPQRGDKSIHELLSRQIDDSPPLVRCGMGEGLQEMGFT